MQILTKATQKAAPTAPEDLANKQYVDSKTNNSTVKTRKINTTAPLAGGGDLSADRTLSVANATTKAKGVVQLSSATNSTSEALAATPKAVKAACDLANQKLPVTGGTINGNLEVTGSITTRTMDSFRHAYGRYGVFWRNDEHVLYLLLTNAGDANGGFNHHRPFRVDLATGTPHVPTPDHDDYSERIVNTAWVHNHFANVWPHFNGRMPLPHMGEGVGQIRGTIRDHTTEYRLSLPPGGVWFYWGEYTTSAGRNALGEDLYHQNFTYGVASGGTRLAELNPPVRGSSIICWRIA